MLDVAIVKLFDFNNRAIDRSRTEQCKHLVPAQVRVPRDLVFLVRRVDVLEIPPVHEVRNRLDTEPSVIDRLRRNTRLHHIGEHKPDAFPVWEALDKARQTAGGEVGALVLLALGCGGVRRRRRRWLVTRRWRAHDGRDLDRRRAGRARVLLSVCADNRRVEVVRTRCI